MHEIVRVLVGIALGLAIVWTALIVALLAVRPHGAVLAEALRILPDTVRLLQRLAADRSLPFSVRLRLWLVLIYLLIPIDIVPDFIPFLGHADDAIIVALVLRSVVRRAGFEAIDRHWPGTQDGMAAVQRLARLGAG